MTKAEISALLGRPLTSNEDTNFTLYLKIARQSLDDMLCTRLCDTEPSRTYDARRGYSTLFTDIFTNIDKVTIDDVVIDPSEYSIRQWDRRNGSWYNSIVFDNQFTENSVVVVTGNWGFAPMPVDLQYILAGLFAQITRKNKFDGTVQSKRVEDFHVTFNTDADLDDEFYSTYRKTIDKYSLCNIGNLQHGRVC